MAGKWAAAKQQFPSSRASSEPPLGSAPLHQFWTPATRHRRRRIRQDPLHPYRHFLIREDRTAAAAPNQHCRHDLPVGGPRNGTDHDLALADISYLFSTAKTEIWATSDVGGPSFVAVWVDRNKLPTQGGRGIGAPRTSCRKLLACRSDVRVAPSLGCQEAREYHLKAFLHFGITSKCTVSCTQGPLVFFETSSHLRPIKGLNLSSHCLKPISSHCPRPISIIIT